ncbi:VOC family protein [Janthinobacterium fluminis]|uniref:Glyoxalase n=1 Tax=Janthinobacterium fluminis TaxID=2987524 RepID=A0ABT5K6G8_9BURK|nr:VOC family protein [Janthinobacterium fluminis]MDC8760519.1 glyoxalase [Janthinobacterium fluminis]
MNISGALEIKVFVPAKNFKLSMAFYEALGFEVVSIRHGVALLSLGECSFLLRDGDVTEQSGNCMMHLLVDDVDAWWQYLSDAELGARFEVRMSPVADQPWGTRDFKLNDPSGVLWHIGQHPDTGAGAA